MAVTLPGKSVAQLLLRDGAPSAPSLTTCLGQASGSFLHGWLSALSAALHHVAFLVSLLMYRTLCTHRVGLLLQWPIARLGWTYLLHSGPRTVLPIRAAKQGCRTRYSKCGGQRQWLPRWRFQVRCQLNLQGEKLLLRASSPTTFLRAWPTMAILKARHGPPGAWHCCAQ